MFKTILGGSMTLAAVALQICVIFRGTGSETYLTSTVRHGCRAASNSSVMVEGYARGAEWNSSSPVTYKFGPVQNDSGGAINGIFTGNMGS